MKCFLLIIAVKHNAEIYCLTEYCKRRARVGCCMRAPDRGPSVAETAIGAAAALSAISLLLEQ